MLKRIFALLIVSSLYACTAMKVAQLDTATGRFPTTVKATVVKSEKVDLDTMKSLLLLPDNDFVIGQIANVKYFDETITFCLLYTSPSPRD